MSINLTTFEEQAQAAVRRFWQSREEARAKQAAIGKQDQGERSAVTSGKNMDGFIDLLKTVIVKNGLTDIETFTKKGYLTLPGFFRPTKSWDVLVIHQRKLIAAIELKSQVGSFGNNVNNRCEEALGSATDIWTAYREGAFGESPRPFIGYIMLLEDCKEVHTQIKENSQHFEIFPEFKNASYAKRYELLCHKLIKEGLYDAATLLLSSRDAGLRSEYSELSTLTGLRNFVAKLAGHVAAAAVME